MNEQLSYADLDKLYKELIELYKSSEKITYKDLENYQIKKYSKIVWKNSTLRSKFSKDNITKLKGIYERNKIRDSREQALGVVRELQPQTLTRNQYNQMLDTVNQKYKEQSDILFKDLKDSIETHDKKQLDFVEKAFNTLKVAREFDLKLNKLIDIDDYTRLEIEEIKLERTEKIDKHKIKIDKSKIELEKEKAETKLLELELRNLDLLNNSDEIENDNLAEAMESTAKRVWGEDEN